MTLPTPERHGFPDGTIAVPVPSNGLMLYRLLGGQEPTAKDFEPDYTRPQGQLRGIPELFRASISHWLLEEQALAVSTQQSTPVARVELRPDPLTRVALTELDPRGEPRRGHVDVWGYPRELFAAIVDVLVIER